VLLRGAETTYLWRDAIRGVAWRDLTGLARGPLVLETLLDLARGWERRRGALEQRELCLGTMHRRDKMPDDATYGWIPMGEG
jgi:hypothetical protein